MQSLSSSIKTSSHSLSRRFLTSGSSSNNPSIAPLPFRSVLQVSGPDARKFLKGLSCRDIENTGGGYTGFLNASGRVLHTAFIFPSTILNGSQTYLITHDSSSNHPHPLHILLPPFKLRSKVRIKDVSDEWEVWSAWSSEPGGPLPARTWKLGSGGAAECTWQWGSDIASVHAGEGELGCWDLRAGYGPNGLGKQLLVPRGLRPSLSSSHDTVTPSDYHLRRMLLGVPEGPAEIVPEAALPLESCMDVHGGVDFRKGCYLGQELTVRTYHTGATRKRILPIRLIPTDPSSASKSLFDFISTPLIGERPTKPVSAQEILYHPGPDAASKKPRSAGKILATHDTVHSAGLGLVRLEYAERACWSGFGSTTIGEWLSSENGKMTVSIGNSEWGVWVGKGEAYAAALDAVLNAKNMS